MTLNVDLLLSRHSMCVVTKRLRLESRGFRFRVALYLIYLHIKCDDEIERESFEFQA